MAFAKHVSPDGKLITIGVNGRFDFNMHQEFRKIYEQERPHDAHYVIDLGQAEYLDSSALGMLLLLREHAGGDQANVRIVHCRPEIRKILVTANFHQLFTIA